MVEKIYRLRLTSNQMWVIQSHIYDLCNYSFRNDYKPSDFNSMDSHDVYRIKIYNKETKVGKSYIFNLTEKELKFIAEEVRYFVFELNSRSEDKDSLYYKERQYAQRIINNINKLLDVTTQRDKLLNKLLK